MNDRKRELPVKYSKCSHGERRIVREQYVLEQEGNCFHCNRKLNEPPPKEILDLKINWWLFPQGFLKNPIHLHHDHNTDFTIGAVHAYCNAILWQYNGE
jgi:hypothetical protein